MNSNIIISYNSTYSALKNSRDIYVVRYKEIQGHV